MNPRQFTEHAGLLLDEARLVVENHCLSEFPDDLDADVQAYVKRHPWIEDDELPLMRALVHVIDRIWHGAIKLDGSQHEWDAGYTIWQRAHDELGTPKTAEEPA